MNNSGLWMTRAIMGNEIKALDAINNLKLWMKWMTWDPMSLGL